MRQLWPAILLLTLSGAMPQYGIAKQYPSPQQLADQAAQQSQTATQASAAHAPQQSTSDLSQSKNGDGSTEKALEDQLYNKENELGQAERDRNAAFFQQNLAPDFLYVAFNGLVLAKDKIVDALQHIQISAYEIRNVKYRKLGVDAVQLAYDLTLQGDVAGAPLPHQLYATSIWVRSGNDWRLAYHQTTPARHH